MISDAQDILSLYTIISHSFPFSAMYLSEGDRLTRRKVIENSADAFPHGFRCVICRGNMRVTAKQRRHNLEG